MYLVSDLKLILEWLLFNHFFFQQELLDMTDN